VFIIAVTQFSFVNNPVETKAAAPVKNVASDKAYLFDFLHLDKLGLSRQAFDYAMKGYNYFLSCGKIQNDETVSIIDFSLPSYAKRLFVIDVKKGTVLFNTYVSHGRNSGDAMANEFSNDINSNKSSLGFYTTADTYKGKHGYSLRLNGEEQGINDNVYNRGIVMHSAPYVSEGTIKQLGFLGRSEGCPAVPQNLYKAIIAKIKNGSCLFMYSPNEDYLAHSQILNKIAGV
jgi:hypothetical protein